jgi:hypothetical protein
MLHQLKNSKKMNKNEKTKSLMVGNVPELIEAAEGRLWWGRLHIRDEIVILAATF